MFLNGHHLYAIVTIGDDARQYVLRKFLICAHFLSVLSHSDVAFVYEQGRFVGFELLFPEHVRLFRVPNLCGKYLCVVVLHHTLAPCRYAFAFAAVPSHLHLVEVTVLHGLFRQSQFPVASAFNALELILGRLLPTVEVANEEYLRGVWRPFAENPATSSLVQTVVQMASGKVGESLLAAFCQLPHLPYGMVVPSLDGVFIRFEPGVVANYPDMLLSSLVSCLLALRLALGHGLRRCGFRAFSGHGCMSFLRRVFLCNPLRLVVVLVVGSYASTLKMAFFISLPGAMQGAWPSCGKNTANIPGLQVT